MVQHHLFSVCTYIAFNLFFLFGGRPFIRLLPNFLQETFDLIIVLVSTLWLYHTIKRNPDLYAKEGLAGRFRKQLIKMDFPLQQYFSGRDIEDLNPHEVYVLAKVLPGFTKQKRYEAYKGVLREALEEGYVDTSSSLDVLRQLRIELDISDSEHLNLSEELGVEDPTLLDPTLKRNLENLVRISGYRKALERLMQLPDLNVITMEKIAKSYSISPAEEVEIMQGFDREASVKQKSYFYIERLRQLITYSHSFKQAFLLDHQAVVALLLEMVYRKKKVFVRALLETIADLGEKEGSEIAELLGSLSSNVLQDILSNSQSEWHQRLPQSILTLLSQPKDNAVCSLDIPVLAVVNSIESLLADSNPLIQSVSLYILQNLNFPLSQSWAGQISSNQPLVQEVVDLIFTSDRPATLEQFPILERVTYLFNSDFFQSVDYETLIILAERSYIKSFQEHELITEAGDTCRELLLLVTGNVEVRTKRADRTEVVSSLLQGKVLDELEVLTHTNLTGTITAKSSPTRVLAIPVDSFDNLLDSDRNLAMKVIELESVRLKSLLEMVTDKNSSLT